MEWLSKNIIVIPAFIMASIALIGSLIAIGRWIGRRESFENIIGEFRKTLEDSMGEIRDNINQIFLNLPSPNPAVASSSPLKLTGLGLSISASIEAKLWANSQISKIPPHIKHLDPYEIQQFCFNYINRVKFSEDFTARMNRCAYEKGTSLIEVKKVLAIELRDLLLQPKQPKS